jgi:hypothetical protein
MPYILEVQKINMDGHNEYPEWNGKSEHIGYMNKVFRTKQGAGTYYDKFNPHLRPLNEDNNWCSDWDPNTFFIYIVRERFYEYLKIPPFEDNNSTVE